jgi:hypothetical protein
LLLKDDQQAGLVDALFASSRHWGVCLHFNLKAAVVRNHGLRGFARMQGVRHGFRTPAGFTAPVRPECRESLCHPYYNQPDSCILGKEFRRPELLASQHRPICSSGGCSFAALG